VTHASVVKKLRKICLSFEGAHETNNFGSEWFRIKKKPFCVLSGHRDEPSIAFKAGKTEQGIFLEDPRFFKTPYVGQHGWVSLRCDGELDWEEIEELAKGAYQLVAARKPRG
jgi:predicted DNA-binding protein (MmcQ/YjbR family)